MRLGSGKTTTTKKPGRTRSAAQLAGGKRTRGPNRRTATGGNTISARLAVLERHLGIT